MHSLFTYISQPHHPDPDIEAMEDRKVREIGGLCGFVLAKYKERIEEKRQKRSHSEPGGAVRARVYETLRKPPQVQSLHERPRNRLRKRPPPLPSMVVPKTDLFILEYGPYPQSTQPCNVLGVYSTFDAVTLGAFKHGAFAFSREGLLDGSEYLSTSGRIKIKQTAVQRSGARAAVPESSRMLDNEVMRLDITHPDSQEEEQTKQTQPKRAAVFLAIRKGPDATAWVGIYADKSLAWGAALEDKAMYTISGELLEEKRSIGLNNMPQVSGRIVGGGHHTWMIEQHVIDGPHRGSLLPTSRFPAPNRRFTADV
jgi:hypothetical protein